jgi:hypothetical protein
LADLEFSKRHVFRACTREISDPLYTLGQVFRLTPVLYSRKKCDFRNFQGNLLTHSQSFIPIGPLRHIVLLSIPMDDCRDYIDFVRRDSEKVKNVILTQSASHVIEWLYPVGQSFTSISWMADILPVSDSIVQLISKYIELL